MMQTIMAQSFKFGEKYSLDKIYPVCQFQEFMVKRSDVYKMFWSL